MKDIKNTLLNKFSFHDGKILLAEKRNNDFILRFKDGWNENQINEIIFIDIKSIPSVDLNNKIILQLEDTNYTDFWKVTFSIPSSEPNIYIPELVTISSLSINLKQYIDNKLIKEENI